MNNCFKRLTCIPVLVLFFIIGSGYITPSYSQNNDNNLELDMYVSSGGVFNTEEMLENELVVSNAFSLRVETENNHASVYASIPNGIRTAWGQTMPTSNIVLKFNSTNCNSGYQRQVVKTEIPMAATNKFLFQQGRRNNYSADWYYDVILEPIGYSVAPGTYYFTLLFTMTQP